MKQAMENAGGMTEDASNGNNDGTGDDTINSASNENGSNCGSSH